MKLLRAALLCLLVSPAATAQTKQVLELRGELPFGDAQERILAHRFLGGENRLVLAGLKSVKVLDVVGAKFVESVSVEVPEFGEDRPRLLSPDGRWMLVFGNYGSKEKRDKVKRPPTVWDLRTGKQVAALDKTARPIRAAVWSRNGKTLATSSERCAPCPASFGSAEVSFWDGETFEYKNSLPTDKAAWWHLSHDGAKCVYTGGESRSVLLLVKYLAPASPVSVWDVSGGKVEQTLPLRDGNVELKILNMLLSPDEKFMLFISQPPKSKDEERRAVVWEIDRGGPGRFELRSKYELSPSPKINEKRLGFSPDGKFFAIDAGKSTQVYEARTGEKRFELPNDLYPHYWLDDDRVILYVHNTKMEAYEAATGRQLYREPLVYVTYTSTPSSPSNEPDWASQQTVVLDETRIVPHPSGRIFLTHSKQYVKVFDSRTGEVLQTLVSPPTDYTKTKPRLSDRPLVSRADWSDDGKTLYVISADEKSVSLWGLTN